MGEQTNKQKLENKVNEFRATPCVNRDISIFQRCTDQRRMHLMKAKRKK